MRVKWKSRTEPVPAEVQVFWNILYSGRSLSATQPQVRLAKIHVGHAVEVHAVGKYVSATIFNMEAL